MNNIDLTNNAKNPQTTSTNVAESDKDKTINNIRQSVLNLCIKIVNVIPNSIVRLSDCWPAQEIVCPDPKPQRLDYGHSKREHAYNPNSANIDTRSLNQLMTIELPDQDVYYHFHISYIRDGSEAIEFTYSSTDYNRQRSNGRGIVIAFEKAMITTLSKLLDGNEAPKIEPYNAFLYKQKQIGTAYAKVRMSPHSGESEHGVRLNSPRQFAEVFLSTLFNAFTAVGIDTALLAEVFKKDQLPAPSRGTPDTSADLDYVI